LFLVGGRRGSETSSTETLDLAPLRNKSSSSSPPSNGGVVGAIDGEASRTRTKKSILKKPERVGSAGSRRTTTGEEMDPELETLLGPTTTTAAAVTGALSLTATPASSRRARPTPPQPPSSYRRQQQDPSSASSSPMSNPAAAAASSSHRQSSSSEASSTVTVKGGTRKSSNKSRDEQNINFLPRALHFSLVVVWPSVTRAPRRRRRRPGHRRKDRFHLFWLLPSSLHQATD
jgi:hypothetical protein